MAQPLVNSAVYVSTPTPVTHGVRRGGFSLIDILVSIAVMAVLISILMPSLQLAQERARRVICSSNLRQIGMAISMYGDEHHRYLPPAEDAADPLIDIETFHQRRAPDVSTWRADTMHVRTFDMTPGRSQSASAPQAIAKWDGLGLLFPVYLDVPQVCYCPSHHGHHPYEKYADKWHQQLPGEVVCNFQYRIPTESSIIDELDPRLTIVTDGMETKLDYSHVSGSNTLKVDGSVGWYEDVDGSLYDSLPETINIGESGPGTRKVPAWKQIDESADKNRRR